MKPTKEQVSRSYWLIRVLNNPPHCSLYKHNLIKKYGRQFGEFKDVWEWGDKLKTAPIGVLKKIDYLCTQSWIDAELEK